MAFDWYYDFDVATIPRFNDGLLDMGVVAYNEKLAHRSSNMMQAIQTIYNRLYQPTPRSETYDELNTTQVLRFLEIKEKVNPRDTVYRELAIEVAKLRCAEIPPAFIERFCLAQIARLVLAEYDLNIAQAYTLAYVMLNKPTDLNSMYFKLGTSGLLSPTVIGGQKIQDVEAIAGVVINSLHRLELLTISDTRWLKPGKKLIFMM